MNDDATGGGGYNNNFLVKNAGNDSYTTHTSMYTLGMDHMGRLHINQYKFKKHIAPGEGFFIYLKDPLQRSRNAV